MKKSDLDFELTKINGTVLCINRNNKRVLFDYISKVISDGIKNYSGVTTDGDDKVYNSSCIVGTAGITYRFSFKNDMYKTDNKVVLTLRISNDNYMVLNEQIDILQKYHDRIHSLNTNKKLAIMTILASIPMVAISLSHLNANTENQAKDKPLTNIVYLTESDRLAENQAKEEYESLYREIGIRLYGENFTQNITEEMHEEIVRLVNEILNMEQGYQKKLV